MDDKELKQILATKAPAYERSFIEIPKNSVLPHLSSLTDYLDKVVKADKRMMNRIDNLVMRYRLGAVDKTMNEHFGTPWTIACQSSLSMRFSRQEYWSGLPFPPPGEFPNPGIEPRSPVSWALTELCRKSTQFHTIPRQEVKS